MILIDIYVSIYQALAPCIDDHYKEERNGKPLSRVILIEVSKSDDLGRIRYLSVVPVLVLV